MAELSRFEKIAAAVGRTVTEKNNAYGDSFNQASNIIKVLYPSGVAAEQFCDMLCVIRIIDKLFRIANRKDGVDPMGESPYADILGYAILGLDKDLKAVEKTV